MTDLFYGQKLAEAARVYAAASAPSISGVTDNRAAYPSSQIPMHSLLEATFSVSTTATRRWLPYDTTWQTNGITVDAEISYDNFATYKVMPCVYIREFSRATVNSQDHFTPTGVSQWHMRYSPSQMGSGAYRIRKTDAAGTELSSSVSFTAVTSPAHGPVYPSADLRYFDHQDGTRFVGLGFNMNSNDRGFSWDDPVQVTGATLATMGSNGIQFARSWLQQWGSVGDTVGTAWASTHAGGTASMWAAANDDPAYPTGAGTPEMCMSLESGWTHSFIGWNATRRAPACKASTAYRVDVVYNIPVAVTSPGVDGTTTALGFTVKTMATFPASTVVVNGRSIPICQDPAQGTKLFTPVPGPTAGWVTSSGTMTTGASQRIFDYICLTVNNGNATPPNPRVYVASITIREDLGSGNYGPNLLGTDSFELWAEMDQQAGAATDLFISGAEANGVYLKLECNDSHQWFRQRLTTATGIISATASETQFHGTTAGQRARYLAYATARYVHGRWGYSPAVHTEEYVNEGAITADHSHAADAWAVTLKAFANPRMVATSTYAQMQSAFYASAPNLDYTDLHTYQDGTLSAGIAQSEVIGPSTVTLFSAGDWGDSAQWQADLSAALTPAATGLGRPAMLGEGALIDLTDGFGDYVGLIVSPVDASATYWRKRLWAQVHAGGIPASTEWQPNLTIYNASLGIDRRPLFKVFYDWVKQFPISNGHYVDSGATVSDTTRLRVWGQKDLTNQAAHLWVDNKGNTWKQVAQGGSVTAGTGTVTLPGMAASTSFTAIWTNTTTGAVIQTDSGQMSNGSGTLVLTLPSSISTDIAVAVSTVVSGAARRARVIWVELEAPPASTIAIVTRTVPATAATTASARRAFVAWVELEVPPAPTITTATRTVPMTVAILKVMSRTVPETVAIRVSGTRTTPLTAALTAVNVSRTAPATAALMKAGLARTVPATGSLVGAATRTVPETLALAALGLTRPVPDTLALAAPGLTRTVPQTAGIGMATTRPVPLTASVQVPATRAVPTTIAVSARGTRTALATGAILATSARSVSETLALSGRAARAVSLSAAIGGVSVVVPLTGTMVKGARPSGSMTKAARLTGSMAKAGGRQ